MEIFIWGVGPARALVRNALVSDKCRVVGYIDNNPAKIGTTIDDLSVYSLGTLRQYDYVITSIREFKAVKYQFKECGYDLDTLICFFDEADWDKYGNLGFVNKDAWKVVLLEEQIGKLKLRLRNAKYENLDTYGTGEIVFPKIGTNEAAIDKIINEGCSLIRFGDGEFEIMAGKNRAPFQKCTDELGSRMRDIVRVNNDKLLICIADNYGRLDKYTEEIADDIRTYMTEDVRRFHLSVIDLNKLYYDTYMFKTFNPYKDKENTPKRIANIKRIWDKKNIIIIEGDKTRTGVGNDLLDNAASIERLLAPTKNAFDKYEEIKAQALSLPKNKMILMVLGPAGKVLAYDLFKAGYQVVDIGQIDMDYDWYKSGLGYKTTNKYKYVSQIAEQEILDVDDPVYQSQIIAKVL